MSQENVGLWGINVVRGGKIVSVQTYLNGDSALEAGGLREWAQDF